MNAIQEIPKNLKSAPVRSIVRKLRKCENKIRNLILMETYSMESGMDRVLLMEANDDRHAESNNKRSVS